MNWFASGGTQLILLVLVVAAVGLGIAATVRRERAAAKLARRRMEAEPPRLDPVASAAPAPAALALLEFDDDPGLVPIQVRSVTIGRHSEDTVRVKDVTVSRHHALLHQRDDGRFEIVNQTTARTEPNPVMVNGVYREKAELADGDLVTLGSVTFRFRDKSNPAAA